MLTALGHSIFFSVRWMKVYVFLHYVIRTNQWIRLIWFSVPMLLFTLFSSSHCFALIFQMPDASINVNLIQWSVFFVIKNRKPTNLYKPRKTFRSGKWESRRISKTKCYVFCSSMICIRQNLKHRVSSAHSMFRMEYDLI